MLQSTFLHLKGVGKTTEALLWQKGITTWRKFIQNREKPLLPPRYKTLPVKESLDAFKRNEWNYFAARLPLFETYRTALTFPAKTLFLDVKTTGGSLYYDTITLAGWSVNRKYGLYLAGEDDVGLKAALKDANVVITFNGTLFDLKFLTKTFDDIVIPPFHIDLRYLAKQVGFTGKRKIIEAKTGYHRPDVEAQTQKDIAPLLWYRYRRGDHTALKNLVTVNHADIESMKVILDRVIETIYGIDHIPKEIQSDVKFTRMTSHINWAKRKPACPTPYKIYLKKNYDHVQPLITYGDLCSIHPQLSHKTVVGIDLTASEKKLSGFCVLKANNVQTCRIKSDDDMIKSALDAKADLIALDSSLTLPKGRISCFDDDPGRRQYGITRECERILKGRGIHIYPTLIPSMQQLTQRGLTLAAKFRKRGFPVIEAYPGAIQDILAIPRKGASVAYLADALVEFGLDGNFSNIKISHDELDAVTSAMAALFFWTGSFEPIGNVDEDYLIVPDLTRDKTIWPQRTVIGLSGPMESAKSTVAGYLTQKGFSLVNYQKFLRSVFNSKKEKPADVLLQKKCKQFLRRLPLTHSIVLDGLCFAEDHAMMIETFGPSFCHVYIDAPQDLIEHHMIKNPKEKNLGKGAPDSGITPQLNELKHLSHQVISNQEDLFLLKLMSVQSTIGLVGP